MGVYTLLKVLRGDLGYRLLHEHLHRCWALAAGQRCVHVFSHHHLQLYTCMVEELKSPDSDKKMAMFLQRPLDPGTIPRRKRVLLSHSALKDVL